MFTKVLSYEELFNEKDQTEKGKIFNEFQSVEIEKILNFMGAIINSTLGFL